MLYENWLDSNVSTRFGFGSMFKYGQFLWMTKPKYKVYE